MENGSKKVVLITGGLGFVGSHLVDSYVKSGDTVIVFDRTIRTQRESFYKHVVIFNQDLNNEDAVKEAVLTYQPKVIHHCAGHSKLGEATQFPKCDAQDNILSTLTLIQTLIELQHTMQYLPSLVTFSSTSAIYSGYKNPPFAESMTACPVTPYGIAKLACEEYLRWYSKRSGVPVTLFRYANVYGPRQASGETGGVVAKFLDKLVEGQDITAYGTGKQTRDYIYVEDIVAAHRQADNVRYSGVLNLGTGKSTTTLQLAEECMRLSRGKVRTHQQDAAYEEQSASYLDVTQAKKCLQWEAQTSLVDGLKKTYKWYEDIHTHQSAAR